LFVCATLVDEKLRRINLEKFKRHIIINLLRSLP